MCAVTIALHCGKQMLVSLCMAQHELAYNTFPYGTYFAISDVYFGVFAGNLFAA